MFRDYHDPLNDLQHWWCRRQMLNRGLGTMDEDNWWTAMQLCTACETTGINASLGENATVVSKVCRGHSTTASTGAFEHASLAPGRQVCAAGHTNCASIAQSHGANLLVEDSHIVETLHKDGVRRCGVDSKLRFVKPLTAQNKSTVASRTRKLFKFIQVFTNAQHTEALSSAEQPVNCPLTRVLENTAGASCAGKVTVTQPRMVTTKTTRVVYRLMQANQLANLTGAVGLTELTLLMLNVSAGNNTFTLHNRETQLENFYTTHNVSFTLANVTFYNASYNVTTQVLSMSDTEVEHVDKIYNFDVQKQSIADYLAVHLSMQDMYLSAGSDVQLKGGSVYKLQLQFDYYGTNSLSNLSFIDDRRFGHTHMQQLYESAVQGTTTALDTDNARTMFGFDMRYTLVSGAANRGNAAHEVQRVAFALNERVCTQEAMRRRWTLRPQERSIADYMLFSRYDTRAIRRDSRLINFYPTQSPTGEYTSQIEGVHYGMARDEYGCITGYDHAVPVPMIGSNAITNNYQSHGPVYYDRGHAVFNMDGVRRELRQGAAEVEWDEDTLIVHDEDEQPEHVWNTESERRRWRDFAQGARADADRQPPPQPAEDFVVDTHVLKQARLVVQSLAELIVAKRKFQKDNPGEEFPDFYELPGWKTVERRSYEPKLVHQIQSGIVHANSTAESCRSLFWNARNVHPDDMSTVERAGWTACAMHLLGGKGADDRRRSMETGESNWTAVDWITTKALEHASSLVEVAATRALPSFVTRRRMHDSKLHDYFGQFKTVANMTVHHEKRRMQTAWRVGAPARKAKNLVINGITTSAAEKIVTDSSLMRESDTDFYSRYQGSLTGLQTKRLEHTWGKHRASVETPLFRKATDFMGKMTFEGLDSAVVDVHKLVDEYKPLMSLIHNSTDAEVQLLSEKYPKIQKWLFRTTQSVLDSKIEKEKPSFSPGEGLHSTIEYVKDSIADLGLDVATGQRRSRLVGTPPAGGQKPQAETVKKMADTLLEWTDAKSYVLDALNVKIEGMPWTDPTPRREWRHDSKQHTPLGRVVRGVMSGVFPEHYNYNDHDETTRWFASGFRPQEGYVTKNLTATDFAHVAMIARHRPHMRLGNKLSSSPEDAAVVMEKTAMLIELIEGKVSLRQQIQSGSQCLRTLGTHESMCALHRKPNTKTAATNRSARTPSAALRLLFRGGSSRGSVGSCLQGFAHCAQFSTRTVRTGKFWGKFFVFGAASSAPFFFKAQIRNAKLRRVASKSLSFSVT